MPKEIYLILIEFLFIALMIGLIKAVEYLRQCRKSQNKTLDFQQTTNR